MINKCKICNKEFKTYRPSQQTCSKKCMGINHSGKNNPNFGKHWTDEEKLAASILKKEQFKSIPGYAENCGKSNRGVKFSQDRITAMHGNRSKESYQHYPTDEVRKLIGEKSKEKWTPEFKEKYRKTMEDAGHWIPLKDKDPYAIYYKEANWIGSMIEFFDQSAIDNLAKFGIFGKKNSKGWVRDHIVPRMIGFEFNIPHYILQHPANLQFISHAANISKGFADRRLTSTEKECIIDTLLQRITEYTHPWKNQEACVDYIRNINENLHISRSPFWAH